MDTFELESLLEKGVGFRDRGEFRDSVRIFSRVKELDVPDKVLAFVLHELSGAYYELGELNNALKSSLASADIYRRLRAYGDLLDSYSLAGAIYQKQGEFGLAIECFSQVIKIAIGQDNVQQLLKARLDMSKSYRSQGDYSKATEILEKGKFQLGQGIDAKSCAEYYNELGALQMNMGLYGKASDYFTHALEELKPKENNKILDHSLFHTVSINLSHVYFHDRKFDKSKELLLAAKDYFEKVGNPAKLSYVYEHLAASLLMLGEKETGLNLAFQGLEFELRGERYPNLLSRFRTTSLLLIGQKDYKRATYFLDKGIEVLETIREKLPFEQRKLYLEKKVELYHILSISSERAGDHANLFRAMEGSKSRVFEERYEGEINQYSLDEVQSRIGQDEVVLCFSNTKHDSPIGLGISKDSTISLEINALDIDELVMGELWDFINDQIGSIQERLWKFGVEEEEGEVKYLNKRMIYAFSVLPQNLKNGLSIKELINGYRFLVSTLSSGPEQIAIDRLVMEVGKILYLKLIKPFEKLLNSPKRILIVPEGNLFLLPFETLVSEKGTYLIEDHIVSYAESVRLAFLFRDMETNSPQLGTFIGFGDPIYQKGNLESLVNVPLSDDPNRDLYLPTDWAALPDSRIEISEVSKYFQEAACYYESECSKSKVLEINEDGQLERASHLLFSCHGHILPDFPDSSGLVLSSPNRPLANIKDQFLLIPEIEKLKIGPSLVILSACNSAIGKVHLGEGIMGLQRAFLLAGAKSVLASSWPLESSESKDFNVNFHSLLSTGNFDYAEALAFVKRKYIASEFKDPWENNDRPYIWAGFVLTGY